MPKSKYLNPVGRKPGLQDPFVKVVTYVPKGLHSDLCEHARKQGTTVERVIVRAVRMSHLMNGPSTDNFFIDLGLPSIVSIQPHEEEIVERVLQFITKADRGIDLEAICLCANDMETTIGMVKKAIVALCVRGAIKDVTEEDDVHQKFIAVKFGRSNRLKLYTRFEGQRVRKQAARKFKKVTP